MLVLCGCDKKEACILNLNMAFLFDNFVVEVLFQEDNRVDIVEKKPEMLNLATKNSENILEDNQVDTLYKLEVITPICCLTLIVVWATLAEDPRQERCSGETSFLGIR